MNDDDDDDVHGNICFWFAFVRSSTSNIDSLADFVTYERGPLFV